MDLTLVRNATLLLDLGGRRLILDPMLDPPGARPPVPNTANPRPNPLVALPRPAEELAAGLDAVLVTHLHSDHLDETAVARLESRLPVACQPPDEPALRERGFADVRPIIMDAGDVVETARAAPRATVVAVHLEALNHCPLTRAQLRAAVDDAGVGGGVRIPADGETLRF